MKGLNKSYGVDPNNNEKFNYVSKFKNLPSKNIKLDYLTNQYEQQIKYANQQKKAKNVVLRPYYENIVSL